MEQEQYEAQEVNVINRRKEQREDGIVKWMNEYELEEKIGRGSYSVIRKVKRWFLDEEGERSTAVYAMKVFNKRLLQHKRFCKYISSQQSIMTNYLHQVHSEILIWKTLNHPRLVKLYQINDDPEVDKLYLVMEYCQLGQLMFYQEEEGKYIHNPQVKGKWQEEGEHYVKAIMSHVCASVQVLHKAFIAHRDIKVDNILVKQEQGVEHIKLADFTIATQVTSEEQKVYDGQGTPGFRAPEVVMSTSEGYLPLKADIWGLGVTMYVLLTSCLPFPADSELQMDLNALNHPLPSLHSYSSSLSSLLSLMLHKDPLQRPTIQQVINHPWFNT